jgi:hypothetical protein
VSVETDDTMRGDTLRIPLSQGQFALIDTADWHLIAGRPWYAKKARDRRFFAVTMERKPKRRQRTMHETIMGRKWVDHRNLDSLDNRRENLRPCTNTENIRNRGAIRGSLLPYKGVYLYKPTCKYRASICYGDRDYHLGYFDNPISAALAYDRAAAEHHGEFGRLNFPKE